MTIITMNYFCNTYFCFKFYFCNFFANLFLIQLALLFIMQILMTVMNCLCSSIVSPLWITASAKCINVNIFEMYVLYIPYLMYIMYVCVYTSQKANSWLESFIVHLILFYLNNILPKTHHPSMAVWCSPPFPSPHSSCAAPARWDRPPPLPHQSSTAAPGTWHPAGAAGARSRSTAPPTADGAAPYRPWCCLPPDCGWTRSHLPSPEHPPHVHDDLEALSADSERRWPWETVHVSVQ